MSSSIGTGSSQTPDQSGLPPDSSDATEVTSQGVSKAAEKGAGAVAKGTGGVESSVSSSLEQVAQDEQTQEADRLQSDRLMETEDQDLIQQTNIKDSQLESLNKATPDNPNLDEYPFSGDRNIDVANLDSLAQKMGADPVKFEKSENSFDIENSSNNPEKIQAALQKTANASSQPILEAPQSKASDTPQAGATSPTQSNAGVQFYMSGNDYVMAAVRSGMTLEQANRFAMQVNADMSFKLALTQINTSKEVYDQSIAAGKAKAKATRMQGEQALWSGVANFGAVALGSGLGMSGVKGGKALPKLGEYGGQLASGGISMHYSLKTSKQQIIETTAEATVQKLNQAQQSYSNAMQTLQKGSDQASQANQAVTSGRQEIFAARARRSQAMSGA